MGLAVAALLSVGLAAVNAQKPELLSASYTTIVDQHVSEIMPLFLNDDLNFEWADRLLHQEVVYTREHGALAYQQHSMPWPLAPRDLLLSCKRNTDHRAAVLVSECKSVNHDAAPNAPGFVRFQLSRTLWRVESLSGDRTKLHLEIEVPASSAYGVPRGIVRHLQKTSLKDSVTALLAAVERLALPPDERFSTWKRSRAQAAAALRAVVPAHRPSLFASLLTVLGVLGKSCEGGLRWMLFLGLLLALMHVLSFSVLAQIRRRLTSGARAHTEAPTLAMVDATVPPKAFRGRELPLVAGR